MRGNKLREEPHGYINHADERFLKMGYNLDGSLITKTDLVKRARAASARVKSGDFISQEEVEKEIDNW